METVVTVLAIVTAIAALFYARMLDLRLEEVERDLCAFEFSADGSVNVVTDNIRRIECMQG